MNSTIQDILERRSVRAFEDRSIPKEDLETIAKCGAYAPSALNRQSRRFTVITEQSKLETLWRVVGKATDRDPYDMYRPTAVIIPSDEKDNPFFKEDLSCALQNLFLAAHALGIGSVWINQLGTCDDVPEVRAFLDSLGIPSPHGVLGIAALGYAKPEGIRPPKKTNEIVFAD